MYSIHTQKYTHTCPLSVLFKGCRVQGPAVGLSVSLGYSSKGGAVGGGYSGWG